MTEEYDLVPPDGGWGWMVVLGVALNYMTGQSMISVFSLIFGDKLLSMGHQTTSAAVLMNVMNAVTNFSGLLTGPLLKRYSMRQVALTGSCLIASGAMLTSFANSFGHIVVTWSFFVGIGMGLTTPANFLAVKSYFQKARGRAVGLSMAGANCGQMAMPHVVRLLLQSYGFFGTTLVLGAIALHGLVGSMLFQPLEWHAERRTVEKELQPLKASSPRPIRRRSNAFSSMASLAQSDVGDMVEVVLDEPQKRLPPLIPEKEEEGEARLPGLSIASVWRRVSSLMDLDLLRNIVYLNVAFGTSAILVSTVNYSLLLPFYLQRDVGMNMSDTAFCLTMMAAGDFLSRLTVPHITEKIRATPRYTCFVGSVFIAVTRSMIATSRTLLSISVWNALCGFSRGAAIVNLNLSVADVVPAEKLPSAVGLNMVFSGIVLLAVGPLLGYIRDETHDYPLCMHLLSGLVMVAMTFWLIEILITRLRKRGG